MTCRDKRAAAIFSGLVQCLRRVPVAGVLFKYGFFQSLNPRLTVLQPADVVLQTSQNHGQLFGSDLVLACQVERTGQSLVDCLQTLRIGLEASHLTSKVVGGFVDLNGRFAQQREYVVEVGVVSAHVTDVTQTFLKTEYHG